MNVSIDMAQCTSSGICEVIAPDVFLIGPDGLAHLVDEPRSLAAEGSLITCAVRAGHEAAVREAAEQCPGECIFIQP
jgi:ferredoxin